MPVLAALIPAAIGGVEAIVGGINKRKAEKNLQNQQTPGYAPNKAINDYYQSALNRYAAGPYNSAAYGVGKKNAADALGVGLSAAGDRRSGVASAGALTQMYNNNLQNAAVSAERQGNTAFAQLGQATGQKAADDKYGFNINSMLPYNKNRELYAAQLGGANQVENAGLENVASGANDAASILSAQSRNGLNFWGKPNGTRSGGGYNPMSYMSSGSGSSQYPYGN